MMENEYIIHFHTSQNARKMDITSNFAQNGYYVHRLVKRHLWTNCTLVKYGRPICEHLIDLAVLSGMVQRVHRYRKTLFFLFEDHDEDPGYCLPCIIACSIIFIWLLVSVCLLGRFNPVWRGWQGVTWPTKGDNGFPYSHFHAALQTGRRTEVWYVLS